MSQDELVPLTGIDIIMAADPAAVVKRFRKVNKRGYPRVEHMDEMREGVPVAIVAGGPSLNDTYHDLKNFRKIMACGSVHNHLVELGINPTWTVVCDPDPVAAEYITAISPGTKYLISSACAEEVFDVVSDRDFAVWNCGDRLIDSEKWRDQGAVFGGGCTVLTRAIWIAGVFGYWNMHFFGCDTSIRQDGTHHAYGFVTDNEEIGDVVQIRLGEDGEIFLVPNYLVGQLCDLRTLITSNAHRIRVTVHGDGIFAEMMAEAKRRAEHGNQNGFAGAGNAPVPCAQVG